MHIHNLSGQNSVLNHFLAQIREIGVQDDSMRFRRNIERIGEIMAYEISKNLTYESRDIPTPLGTKTTQMFTDDVVVCSVLRAGLPLHQGFLNYFDKAESGFVSAFRNHYDNTEKFNIEIGYQAAPDISGKTLLLVDPMLATGQSLVAVMNNILASSAPGQIHVAAVIAAPEGVAYVEQHFPDYCHLWIASVDEKLNEKSYIVPGLGDAGDLAYGPKL